MEPETLTEAGLLERLIGGENLGLFFWIGFVAITVALVVLMRTRWGQAKPLSKCVVLSVFAHVLLVAYAYGTKFIFDVPPPREEEYIKLAVLADEMPQERESESASSEQPWNRLASEEVEAPDVAALERNTTQIQATESEVEAALPEFSESPSVAEMNSAELERPVAEAPEIEPSFQAAAPETEVEAPAPAASAAPEPEFKPPHVPSTLARRTSVDGPRIDPLASPDQTENPSPLFESSQSLQRLSDVEANSEGEALPDRIDELAASFNQAGDAALGSESEGITQQIVGSYQSNAAERNQVAADVVSGALQMPISRLGDGQPMPELYRLRTLPQRLVQTQQWGATPESEDAVQAALTWLVAHQESDGRWSAARWGGGTETKVLGHDRQGAGARADTGMTGLALLAFLASGNSHYEGTHRRTVQRGLEFLLGAQKSDGDLADNAQLFARMYCHGIASLALSEAFALTGDPRLRTAATSAVNYTISTQHRETGGWRYQAGDRGDTSQFGWQVMALKSAELAGIRVPGQTRAGMLRFLRSVTSGTHGGLASYRVGEQVSRTMTAEALASRILLGIETSPSTVDEAANFIMQELPGHSQDNLYYWYYASMALFQVQDQNWVDWNEALQTRLLQMQRRQGESAGSWDPTTVWGHYGGRVYTTAMGALCLQVYYRYLPLSLSTAPQARTP